MVTFLPAKYLCLLPPLCSPSATSSPRGQSSQGTHCECCSWDSWEILPAFHSWIPTDPYQTSIKNITGACTPYALPHTVSHMPVRNGIDLEQNAWCFLTLQMWKPSSSTQKWTNSRTRSHLLWFSAQCSLGYSIAITHLFSTVMVVFSRCAANKPRTLKCCI